MVINLLQALPANYDTPALTVEDLEGNKAKKQANRLYTWIKNETVRTNRHGNIYDYFIIWQTSLFTL